jgi:hypothetical protein
VRYFGSPYQDAPAAGAHVDPAVHARVADDDTAEAELVSIVVDPHPGDTGVVRAVEACHVFDLAHEIQGRILLALGRLAKADLIRLGHAVDGL